MPIEMESHILKAAARHLRGSAATWAASALLPLPLVLAVDPAASAEASCMYLALSCAWLAASIELAAEQAQTPIAWAAKTLAITIAAAVNVSTVILFATAAGVKSNIPFPLLASLSALPSVALIPCLTARLRQPLSAFVFTAALALAAKLIGCVAARLAYGPDFDVRGYVAGDWSSAKLMISVFWALTVLMSLAPLVAEYRRAARRLGTPTGPGITA